MPWTVRSLSYGKGNTKNNIFTKKNVEYLTNMITFAKSTIITLYP